MKKITPKQGAIFFVLILGFISVIFGIYLFIQTHQFFAANFADEFLRPKIGSQATISIEAQFFSLQDLFNQIKYIFVKPTVNQKFVGAVSNIDNSFTLFKIPPLTSFPLLPHEGEWSVIVPSSTSALLATTFVRPDPKRDYAITYLVKMNMSELVASAAAGTWEPGEQNHRGTGAIPMSIIKSNKLIAAFNGGFQKKDGEYGMIVQNTTYLPLKKNLATIVLYTNKKPEIFNYTDQIFSNNVSVIRQNGPMLLENGQIVTASSDWNMQTWGLTTTNSMYTWRSGIGVTKNGNLIYAAGASLIPQTLAIALKAAGAVNAMQLDINPVWVRFITFTSLGNSLYKYTPLTSAMVNGGYEYLHGYQKDFFYIYRK
ncbi:MAG TPA: phosphodiester glycosidase family protein [Patescibacteria group bacterium]